MMIKCINENNRILVGQGRAGRKRHCTVRYVYKDGWRVYKER